MVKDINAFVAKTRDSELGAALQKLESPFEAFHDMFDTAFLDSKFICMSGPDVHYETLADGYFETAIFLLQETLLNNQNRKADIWLFPIFSHCLQGCELYLKTLNAKINAVSQFQQQATPPPLELDPGHNIQLLCRRSLLLLEQQYRLTEEQDHFTDYADELQENLSFVQRFIELLCRETNQLAFMKHAEVATNPLEPDQLAENKSLSLSELLVWVIKVQQCLQACTAFVNSDLALLDNERHETFSYPDF